MHQLEPQAAYWRWTLDEWLSALENRYAQEIQLGLARISQVAAKLNLLSPQAKIITVAGTNGKGSTVTALQAIYQAGNYNVGTYMSPHLLRFNERIKINDHPISDEDLIQFFCTIEVARESTHLTYFETATLAALLYFQQANLDVIILEVGIGGRLDATNIIDSDLAIITTIDFDHQDYLGDTLEKIGAEKAGILRAYKPMIFADVNSPASILAQAKQLNCPPFFNKIHYSYQLRDSKLLFTYQQFTLSCQRPHLHPNAIAAALMAHICLQNVLPLSSAHLTTGLNKLVLPGRLQQIVDKNYISLLDVSHNAQSVRHLAQFIKDYYPKKKVHAVFSALADKAIPDLIAPLNGLVSDWYPALLTGKRAASAYQLIAAFSEHGIEIDLCHNSPLDAYKYACKQANFGDLIVVYGSFLTVCQTLPYALKATQRGEINEIYNG